MPGSRYDGGMCSTAADSRELLSPAGENVSHNRAVTTVERDDQAKIVGNEVMEDREGNNIGSHRVFLVWCLERRTKALGGAFKSSRCIERSHLDRDSEGCVSLSRQAMGPQET